MIDDLTRIAGLVLAFGFFISCSTLQSSNQEATSPESLTEKQIQQQLQSLDSAIAENSEQADLYFRKGKLLTQLAKKKDSPSNRKAPYTEARKALEQAQELYDTSKENATKVSDLLNVTWSLEHNLGVKYLQGESIEDPNYSKAVAHFKNATVIIPDSANSYTMMARALYKDQQSNKAISVLENARSHITNPPVDLLEQLAFLYLENDKPQKAIAVYEQAESFSDENLNVLHGLSNAYINAGEHPKAIALLQELKKNEPENIIYAQTLATELFFVGKSEIKAITKALRSNSKNITEARIDSAMATLAQAEEIFSTLVKENPENMELKERAAQFYYNSASQYQQLIPLVTAEQKEHLKEEMTQYLAASVPLFESLVQQDQPNKKYWEQLYKVYSLLGMDQEAENAKNNL